MRKITSTEVREKRPQLGGCVFVMGLVTLAAILLLFASMADTNAGGGVTGVMLVLTAVLAMPTWRLWKRNGRIEYQLFLITSAAEQQAFTSRDRGEVVTLRDEIESAMARASRSGIR
jgi:hypothetical protein